MNNAQRDLLAKALADISKGIFIGVLLAGATDKLFFYEACLGVLFAVLLKPGQPAYIAGHTVAGGKEDD